MIGTVVIGAGAAGIAAARTLHDAGEDVLLLDARDRLGGRARSEPLALPDGSSITADLGCGWLHSATRNPWTTIAESEGFAVDRTSPGWRGHWRDLDMTAAEQASFGAAWDAMEARTRAAESGPDRPLSDFVPADDQWRPMLDAISGYANGAALAAVSLHDWLAYEDAAGEENWALPAGYGTLVASHARVVPHRLNTPVERVDHGGRVLRLHTSAGVVEAERAIVCVPTTVLASGALTFDPPLPAKRDAAAALPLGLADKAFLAVDRPPWPANAHLIGNPHTNCTASHRLSPFGWPIVESFFGGSCAEALEEGDACAFAIDELVALLGSDWRRRLRPLAATRWRHEAWIGGSYSHARVGHAGARAVLAAPVGDRLFFAGEACSPHDFSTCHGAYQTGVAAAQAILEAKGLRATVGA